MSEKGTKKFDKTFPFPQYRDYQREALRKASNALFENGYETVVLNLPTGIGKSPINVSLARQAESAFITTPQKALRTQLERDGDLQEYYSVLRARDDYNCSVGSLRDSRENYTCKTCPINHSEDESCLHYDNCNYWNRKEQAMRDPVSVLTFSYLIVDGYLPEYINIEDTADTRSKNRESGETQVSFTDRELLIVDECHKLEDQVASLHAGISVSLYSLPEDVFGKVDSEIGELPDSEVTKLEDVIDPLNHVYDRAKQYLEDHSDLSYVGEEEPQDVRDCRNFCKKYDWCLEQISKGRDWVVDRSEISYSGDLRYTIEILPIDIDIFLQEHVWNRAKKKVLSTATMPFPNDADRWIRRLGLDPTTTKVIQYPMPFPADRRQIILDAVVGRMSRDGYQKHRDALIEKLRMVSRKHDGEKGLIHTSSYSRARELQEFFSDNSQRHQKLAEHDLRYQIDQWQLSDDDMFFSPAATDGVDLPGDKCRWQALVKVPYPPQGDPRNKFLIEERGAWDLYYERTSQDIQQSVGRGVRSKDDCCDYYVLDQSFLDVREKANFPDWFEAAIS